MERPATQPLAAVALGLAMLAAPEAALAQAKAAAGVVKVRIIADTYVVVDQHPVVVLESDKVARITWELPGKPSPWRFQDDGIAIDQGQFLGCRVEAQGLKFSCVDKPPPRNKQSYPYRITVHNGAKSIFADSAVQND